MALSLECGTSVFVGTNVVRNTFTVQRNRLRLKVERVNQPPKRKTVVEIIDYFSQPSSWVNGLKLSQAIVATICGVVEALRDHRLHDNVPVVIVSYGMNKIVFNISFYLLDQVMTILPCDPND